MKKSLMLALIVLVSATGATAAAPAPQPAESEKKICRSEQMTGSRTRRTRICMTEAQWRELNNRTRKGHDEMTSAASGGKACVMDDRGAC